MPAENTEVVTQPEAKPETESLEQRMTKFVEAEIGKVATTDSDAAPTEEGAEATAAATTDAAAEAAKDTKAEEPFTNEQLGDPKFYDGLKKDGWDRLERQHPVEFARVKAAYSAAGKIYETARKAKETPADKANDTPATKSLSPELKEAMRKKQSLDETEAYEGEVEFQKLTLRDALQEFGLDPNEAKANAVASKAYERICAAVPEIAKLDPKLLDAEVENDSAFLQMLEVAADLPDAKRIAITESVMRKAGEAVIAKQKTSAETLAAAKKVEDDKKKAIQAKVRSNASIPSNVVMEQPASGATGAKKTMEERTTELWNEAVAANGA